MPLPRYRSRLIGWRNLKIAGRRYVNAAWLKDIEACRLQHNQAYTDAMLEEYDEFFQHVESSPLNPAQARAVVNGEQSLLVLAGAGSGKTSVLVARAGWLLARGEAAPEQILLLAFGRKAAQRWMTAFVSVCIRMRSPRGRSMHWRCTLFRKVAKKFQR